MAEISTKAETRNVFIRMTETTEHRLEVLCSVHKVSKPQLIARLLEEDFHKVEQSGLLSDWLASLSGLDHS